MKVLLIALCVGLAPTAAYAQDDAKAAYARFEDGEIAFEDGNFARAAALFGEAFALHPEPAYLFNRGLSFARLGRPAAAAAVFERFHTTFPGSPRKAEVDRELAAARSATEKRGAKVEIGTKVDGTWRFWLDDPAVPELAASSSPIPGALWADPGTLTVIASDGLIEQRRTKTVAANETWLITIEPRSHGPSTTSWVAWSVGAAGLVSGVVFGALALDAQADGEGVVAKGRAPSAEARLETLKTRVDDYALAADVGFAVALAGAVIGVVAYVTGDSPEEALTWRF